MTSLRIAPLASAALAATLAGCMVGPNYAGPPAVAPIAETAPAFHRAAAAPVTTAAPPARWWEALGDPLLTKLVDQAFAASPTLKEAKARVRQARATLSEQRAGLLPTGGATALYARTRIPTGSFASLAGGGAASSSASSTGAAGAAGNAATSNLYDAGFDASWALDIFGGVRRGIEGAKAQAESREAALADAQVQLAADVARAYVNLRDVQQRLALSGQSDALESRMLALTRDRRRFGTASDADVARLETQLAQTQAGVAPLQSQVEQYEDQLATLTAVEPGQLDGELNAPGALPLPPAFVPVGDPAALLRRRPDIRQAERMIAADTAAIGQHAADLFPSVSLFGTLGYTSEKASNLLSSANLSYVGAPSLSWNVLNFPKVKAQIREAKAGRDEALAAYQRTVLSALQDANTALSRFGRQRDNVEKLAVAEASATRAAALVRQRYAGGTASLIDQLDTERQRVQTQASLAQAQAALTANYVALQAALGLGWGA